jgi:hypothetical protein
MPPEPKSSTDSPEVKVAKIGCMQAIAVAVVTGLATFVTSYYALPRGEKLSSKASAKHAETVDKTLEEAKKRSLPYAIQALTMLVHIGAKNSADDPFHAEVRTCYTVLPLQTTLAAQNTTFTEQYASSYARSIQYWPGSEREILRGRPGEGTVYDVLFDAKQGESHTLITGATFYYDFEDAKEEHLVMAVTPLDKLADNAFRRIERSDAR